MQFVDPEYEPNETERMQLGQVLEMPGFEVVRKIALSEVARFTVRLHNLDPQDPKIGANYDKMVLELNRQAKVSAMIWQGIHQRIENERTALLQETSPVGKSLENPLPDITADILESE